jgi:hypothetical protein
MIDVTDQGGHTVAENQDVTPESSAGTEPQGNPDQAGNPVAPGQGRNLENVYGEFSRKYGQLSERFDAIQQGIEALTKQLGGQQAAKPQAPQSPVSPFGAPRALQDFSDEYITQYLNNPELTPYQRQILVNEQAARNQLKLANQVWDQRREQERVLEEKGRAEQAAIAAFPVLRDPSSDFAKRVNQLLTARRQRFGEFPTDVYDVANSVAREMGIGETRAYTPSTYVAPGLQERVPQQNRGPKKHELGEADIERISERLASAMPSDRQADGKMKRRAFDKKRIKERSKMYADNADLYKHTKLGSDE